MRVLLAHLPRHIGERELTVLERRLGAPTHEGQVLLVPGSQGPGNVVLVDIESECVTEVFVGFGEAGVRAEAVAAGVARDMRQYLAAGVP
jgi:RNA 3'-terminal phosphate cyclase (ATP)